MKQRYKAVCIVEDGNRDVFIFDQENGIILDGHLAENKFLKNIDWGKTSSGSD